MIEFIVRARRAPVTGSALLAAMGQGEGVEYLAQIVVNGLFVSKGHRQDAKVTLVLEKSADYSRAVTLSGGSLGSLAGLHERAILEAIASALDAAQGLAKDASVTDARGLIIRAVSFERLVKETAAERPVYVMSRKGQDIRGLPLPPDAVFVMTDHTPMPAKTFKSLARQGVTPVSLGPVMLHASQCITLIHNEIDRCLRQAISE